MGFVRLTGEYARKGEYYKCSDCGSVFSDMSNYPLWVKAKVLKTHMDRCEMIVNKFAGGSKELPPGEVQQQSPRTLDGRPQS